MKYISTRNNSKEYSFEEVFIKGLADDGGLFIPKVFKKFSNNELNSLSKLSYQDLAKKIIFPFIGNFMSESEFSDIINKSYSVFRKDNVVNLIKIENINVLELFFLILGIDRLSMPFGQHTEHLFLIVCFTKYSCFSIILSGYI